MSYKENDKNKQSVPMQEASLDIWDKKYRLKDIDGNPVDKDINETYERVAAALSDVEETPELKAHWHEKFLKALRMGAIPAGRIMSNAGAQEYKPATSLINCTVSDFIEDSMDGIMRKAHEAALTLRAGCGIGYQFSTLRPKGAFVSGAGAETSGPLSFMDIFDSVCFTVASAGGRRGAQMATFDVSHPDVRDFIKSKREDGRFRQFNLSLLITDEFVEAVKNNAMWPLTFPVSKKEANKLNLNDESLIVWKEWPKTESYISREDGKIACRIYDKVNAGRLWDLIMASTYDFAEPGFILIDRVNEMNNNWWCENIRATNPCVTSDTWVHTSNGPRQVSDLIGVQFEARVDGKDYLTGEQGFFKTAKKNVVELLTREGYKLKLTSDHKVKKALTLIGDSSLNYQWVEAGSLSSGDKVIINNHRTQKDWSGFGNENQGYLLGLLVGDGVIKKDKAVLSVWNSSKVAEDDSHSKISGIMEYAELSIRMMPHRNDFKGWYSVSSRNEMRMSSASFTGLVKSSGMSQGNKIITKTMESGSSQFYKGFLKGFFDADGYVQGCREKGFSVRLSQSDLGMLETTQRMLLRLGIKSKIYKNRRHAGVSILPDGHGSTCEYAIKAQHELVISNESMIIFSENVGFEDKDKLKRLKLAITRKKRKISSDRFVAEVLSVSDAGVQDVYDVQVPGINTFDANGFHAHNCGEQPLPPYGACLLGSINLTKFVLNPFTSQASFDWSSYEETVSVFTRMLDNVVELNGLPLQEQRNEIFEKRRHGMGFLGLGSTITMLKMKYGSQESLEFTEAVSKSLAVIGWKEALSLAKEKGPAPIMSKDFTVTGEMLSKRPEMVSDGYKLGDKIKGSVLHAKYSKYMQKIAEVIPDVVEELSSIGARFTHHSSIAPTGTISLSLANNASNGIEPSFAHKYSRNVIRPGRKAKEKVDVYSYELLAYRTLVNPEADPMLADSKNSLPDYFISADQVTPKQHVDIQAASQIWIDSSISKTANVPTDYPYEDFKDIYMYAHEKGLKGCTTFRFNPEAFQGVLVKESDLENTIYTFTAEDGSTFSLKGNEMVEYDGETHTAANLFDALKEGYYGKF